MNDNWKYDLYKASNGDLINIKIGHTAGEIGTVLTDLVSSYTVFQHKFTQYGNNYLHVPIYCNGNFGYGRNPWSWIYLDSQCGSASLTKDCQH
jgi:hypothetical protein